MAKYNEVVLEGVVGRMPTYKKGDKKGSLSLCVSPPPKRDIKSGGFLPARWFIVRAFGTVADKHTSIQKGDKIRVIGRLDIYDREVYIIAERFTKPKFLGLQESMN